MNKARREKLREIVEELEAVIEEEEAALEGLPENMQDGERAERMREALDQLRDGQGYVDTVANNDM